jgi:hypothetical protein
MYFFQNLEWNFFFIIFQEKPSQWQFKWAFIQVSKGMNAIRVSLISLFQKVRCKLVHIYSCH